jgi:osmotically-inducible protein OsmY
VNNELEVRILTEHRRSDADLRGSVLQAMMLDSLVPSTIDARVDNGVVTLIGRAHVTLALIAAFGLTAGITEVVFAVGG